MIQIQGNLSREQYIACSGGVDSMAIADFLSKNHKVTLLFFDHGTNTSRDAKNFLQDYVYTNPYKFKELKIGTITREKLPEESQEEYWRNQRYEWFHSFEQDVITCHHLDDCVETWVWSSMHGQGKIIPYANLNVIRPFRTNRKSEFENWCRRHNVPWIEDQSNSDIKYMRNFIRKEVISKIEVINPGIYKVIRKKVLEEWN